MHNTKIKSTLASLHSKPPTCGYAWNFCWEAECKLCANVTQAVHLPTVQFLGAMTEAFFWWQNALPASMWGDWLQWACALNVLQKGNQSRQIMQSITVCRKRYFSIPWREGSKVFSCGKLQASHQRFNRTQTHNPSRKGSLLMPTKKSFLMLDYVLLVIGRTWKWMDQEVLVQTLP